MSLSFQWQAIIASLAAGGSIGTAFAISSLCPMKETNTFKKPDFQPPARAFQIIWPILYILIAVALTLYASKVNVLKEKNYAITATVLLTFQLILGFVWIYVFNCGKKPQLGLYILLLILAVTLATMIVGQKVSTSATAILSPYLAWIFFAIILNSHGIVSLKNK
jgi:tryptophan-rich sensory protein